jgi:hypothetical protein
MKIITLNINYDPDLPDFMQGPQQPEPVPPAFPHLFPYTSSRVRILGLIFWHKRVNTGGFDPYAGQRWTCEAGSRGWFSLTLSDVVCAHAEVCFGWKTYRWTELEWKAMPYWSRHLWDFLEDRRGYADYQSACNDPYESLASYE